MSESFDEDKYNQKYQKSPLNLNGNLADSFVSKFIFFHFLFRVKLYPQKVKQKLRNMKLIPKILKSKD